MTESEINALQIEDVVETSKVIEKPKKTTAKKTVKKEEPVEATKKTGVVTGCQFLRIRREAKVGDNVIKEIPEGTSVAILETTDNGFYHVVTQNGDEGFCMTEYIK